MIGLPKLQDRVGAMLEAFGLAWLAGIIGSVLTDSLKERLKPAESDENARNRAFALFERLRNIKSATDCFVGALEEYAALVEFGVSDAVQQLGTIPGSTWGRPAWQSLLTVEDAAAGRVEMLRQVTGPDRTDRGRRRSRANAGGTLEDGVRPSPGARGTRAGAARDRPAAGHPPARRVRCDQPLRASARIRAFATRGSRLAYDGRRLRRAPQDRRPGAGESAGDRRRDPRVPYFSSPPNSRSRKASSLYFH